MEKISAAEYFYSSTIPSMAQYDNLSAGALARGIDKYIAKDYDAAIREFRHAIARSPYSKTALKSFEYLVNTLTKTGKTSEAAEACRQAIKIFPSADGMNLGLGNLYYSEGRYEEATEQYKAAVTKNATANQNVYSLGQGYLALGRYTDAETQFKRAIQLAPKDAGGYYALGQTYRKMGKLTEAQANLEQALAIKKDFTDAHFELGMVYAEQQQAEKADAELAILNEQSSDRNTELAVKIYETTKPRILSAYGSDIYLAASVGTVVSSLNNRLAEPGATKTFTVNFAFSKYMDALSVGTMANWTINRSTENRTGGLYNWGSSITETDVKVSSEPVSVTYDPETLTAKVKFSITQNATANGTVDLSHLVFKFKGIDGYGNAMDPAADEYSAISEIV